MSAKAEAASDTERLIEHALIRLLISKPRAIAGATRQSLEFAPLSRRAPPREGAAARQSLPRRPGQAYRAARDLMRFLPENAGLCAGIAIANKDRQPKPSRPEALSGKVESGFPAESATSQGSRSQK
jgi:hypothetical protein